MNINIKSKLRDIDCTLKVLNKLIRDLEQEKQELSEQLEKEYQVTLAECSECSCCDANSVF